jgi:hypothetical protein
MQQHEHMEESSSFQFVLLLEAGGSALPGEARLGAPPQRGGAPPQRGEAPSLMAGLEE